MSTGPQRDLDSKSSLGRSNNNGPISYTNPSTIPLSSTDPVLENPALSERSMYESEIAKVRRENTHLKDQTRRLNSELRAYQVQFPYANVDSGAKGTTENGVDLPPWMEKEEVMSPLIKAYDSRIAELGAITEKQVSARRRQATDRLRRRHLRLVRGSTALHFTTLASNVFSIPASAPCS